MNGLDNRMPKLPHPDPNRRPMPTMRRKSTTTKEGEMKCKPPPN
jgi:hypothetical protein